MCAQANAMFPSINNTPVGVRTARQLETPSISFGLNSVQAFAHAAGERLRNAVSARFSSGLKCPGRISESRDGLRRPPSE